MPWKYQNYYERKIGGWRDQPDVDVMGVLQSFYDKFFVGDQINFELLTEALHVAAGKDDQLGQFESMAVALKGRELFKELCRFDDVTIRPHALASSDVFNSIKTSFGPSIMAHGISEPKGGLVTLLMIAVTKTVVGQWGLLCDGPPMCSSVPHGPYYVIYKIPATQDDVICSDLSTDEVQYFLVPFPEQIVQLKHRIQLLVQLGITTDVDANAFVDKLIDYEGFLRVLRQQASPRKRRRKAKSDGVFALPCGSLFRSLDSDRSGGDSPSSKRLLMR